MENYDRFLREVFDDSHIRWESFSGKRVLITGANGFIGRLLIAVFCYVKLDKNIEVSIVVCVRDKQKLVDALTDKERDSVQIIEVNDNCYSRLAFDMNLAVRADYLFHCAAPTRSDFFVNSPVETIETIVNGTQEMLLLAKETHAIKLINLSSMEAFGEIAGKNLTEQNLGIVQLDSCRSSYPEAKRLSELLCYAYYKEYGVQVNSVRLAQCFGPESSLEDNRVFMQFCKAIAKGEDIVLHTDGAGTMNYVFPSDAIRAMMYIALDAPSGETYTVVGDAGTFTIRAAAEWMIEMFGSESSHLIVDNIGTEKYPKSAIKTLSNEKICSLGWQPRFSIRDGFERLLSKVKQNLIT